MKLGFLVILIALLNTGCINQKIHQGNVIDADSIWIIQEGDTRFSIESEMGSPAIVDSAHPERALYIEDFYDEETDEKYTRGVEVTYDEAFRAKNIRRFGFE
ncbi:MAG: outer membrane protein assembly factor BamE [Zetaproteobacteria bacterium]|nr:MAG: outer membrane protein assembly factor BamE [Zetaproteobacteria bacterium]